MSRKTKAAAPELALQVVPAPGQASVALAGETSLAAARDSLQGELTIIERLRKRTLADLIDIGGALHRIESQRLYRADDDWPGTFGAWCLARTGWSARYVYTLIALHRHHGDDPSVRDYLQSGKATVAGLLRVGKSIAELPEEERPEARRRMIEAGDASGDGKRRKASAEDDEVAEVIEGHARPVGVQPPPREGLVTLEGDCDPKGRCPWLDPNSGAPKRPPLDDRGNPILQGAHAHLQIGNVLLVLRVGDRGIDWWIAEE